MGQRGPRGFHAKGVARFPDLDWTTAVWCFASFLRWPPCAESALACRYRSRSAAFFAACVTPDGRFSAPPLSLRTAQRPGAKCSIAQTRPRVNTFRELNELDITSTRWFDLKHSICYANDENSNDSTRGLFASRFPNSREFLAINHELMAVCENSSCSTTTGLLSL